MGFTEISVRTIGVFTYDQFPYIVVHDIYGFNDNGDAQIIKNYSSYRSFNSLLAVFKGKKADEVENFIESLKEDYEIKHQKLKNEIFNKMINKYSSSGIERIKEYLN